MVAFAFASPSAQEHQPEFHELKLENGATIICKYVPESPLVTIQIRVLAGLSNEGKYAGSGISHFLEHLLFKGTREKRSDQIRKEIKFMGGVVNGATGLDSAEYHIIVPKENFERALSLLTDMVMEAVFTREEMETERDVILKEIRLRNDDPVSRRMRLLFGEAYIEHIYHYPVMGDEERFKTLTRDDILRYHKAVYTPNKLVVGIVGGVKPENAFKEAKGKLKEYKRGEKWERVSIEEPKQLSERELQSEADITLGYIAIGFHTTDLYSPDLYPTDVLSILIGEGESSRLYKRLVKDKELLYAVSSFNYTPRYPGLFVITGIGSVENLERAKEEIFAVIDEFKKEAIEDAEAEKAKNLVLSAYLRSHERIGRTASSMTSSYLLTGDPAFFKKYVDRIKEVEKNQIKEVSSRYLIPENSTTVFLVPRGYKMDIEEEERLEEAPEQAQVRKMPEQARNKAVSILKAKAKEVATLFNRVRRKISRKVEAKKEEEANRAPHEKYLKLDNGLRIIAKKKGDLPLISIIIAMPGGLRAEDASTNGLSNLTASVILKGTENRSESEIIPRLEELGGAISTFSGMNSAGIAMTLMSKDLDEGMDIFSDVIKNPAFPEEEITKEKKKIIAAIKEEEKDIFEKGIMGLRKLIYGSHPYSMRALGRVETVEKFTRDDINRFYDEYWTPDNAVITVVGDIDIENIVDTIVEKFGKCRRKAKAIPAKEVIALDNPLQEDITMEKEQSLVLLGFQSATVKDERKYPLAVISSILSGSDGLMFYALREERGFVYTSGAVSIISVDPGCFLLYAATTEENIDDVKKGIKKLVKKIADGEIDREEILAAKNKLITQYALSLETNSSVAMSVALDELYGLGWDNYKLYPERIKAVTFEDIVKTAKEILDLEKSATFTIHREPIPLQSEL